MIFDKLRELRATLRNPTKDLLAVLTGDAEKTASGESVSPESALNVAAYFGAIRAISEDVSKIPLPVYRRLPRGRKRLADHTVDQLMNVAPNDEMTPMSFRATMLSHAMGWGNGFAVIQYLGDLVTPYALWPLDPGSVSLWRLDDGTLEYRVTDGVGGIIPYGPRQMFHIHGLGYNGLTGYSIAQHAKESLGLAKAQERAGASLFGSGSRPGGVLQTPNKLKKETQDELREQWERLYGGSSNTNKTAILQAGLVFTPISSPNKDAQWIESRQHSVEEISRWFRIPPHKLQHLLRASYNNIEEENVSYVQDTLMPWMTYFEQEVQRRLLAPNERKTMYVRHNANGLLRGDSGSRFEAYQKAILTGWMSRNEARELEDMNPLPDDQDGDAFLVPVNMAPADQLGEEVTRDDVAATFNEEDTERWARLAA